MPIAKYNMLGEQYITSNAKLRYNSVIDEWILKISENNYHNDTTRNPEKTISVRLLGANTLPNRCIYQGVEDGVFYFRDNYFPREYFARWYISGHQLSPYTAEEPRPNIIFECEGQKERVVFDDWNGVAAYSTTYNVKFPSIKEHLIERR